jgi:Tannase and feruloyl esterase
MASSTHITHRSLDREEKTLARSIYQELLETRAIGNNMRRALLALLVCGLAHYAQASDCAALINGKYADFQIMTAEPVARGGFTPKDESGAPTAIFRELPPFCRVVGVIRPTADSQIGFELWLPDQWNGRYLQIGSGSFGGAINYRGMISTLGNGFAVASTDDGHTGAGVLWTNAAWALGHPEKLVDYGYRAVHLTSLISKQVVLAYYRRIASHTYFSGCSDGGRESLMEAQRYPDDFDGYLVGAPGNDFTGVMTYLLNLAQIASSMKVPLVPPQLEALQKAALARCDAEDGITDGVIENPLKCRFNPLDLQCKGASDGRCLSEDQAKAVSKVYDDTRGGRARVSLTPGFRAAVGDEAAQWPYLVAPVRKESGRSETVSQMFSENFWPFMVYGDSKLDFRTLDLAQAAGDARGRIGAVLNSVDPNLRSARAAGKKIIQYHGWADALIPPQYSIGYYEAVEKYIGGDNRDFYRLFMAPGVAHCGGGPGPNAFGMSYDPRPFGAGYDPNRDFDPDRNVVAALVRWVEKDVAPERIVATKYQDDDAAKAVVRTRPLCVWPKVARWTGKGSTDDAKNFTCAEP